MRKCFGWLGLRGTGNARGLDKDLGSVPRNVTAVRDGRRPDSSPSATLRVRMTGLGGMSVGREFWGGSGESLELSEPPCGKKGKLFEQVL